MASVASEHPRQWYRHFSPTAHQLGSLLPRRSGPNDTLLVMRMHHPWYHAHASVLGRLWPLFEAQPSAAEEVPVLHLPPQGCCRLLLAPAQVHARGPRLRADLHRLRRPRRSGRALRHRRAAEPNTHHRLLQGDPAAPLVCRRDMLLSHPRPQRVQDHHARLPVSRRQLDRRVQPARPRPLCPDSVRDHARIYPGDLPVVAHLPQLDLAHEDHASHAEDPHDGDRTEDSHGRAADARRAGRDARHQGFRSCGSHEPRGSLHWPHPAHAHAAVLCQRPRLHAPRLAARRGLPPGRPPLPARLHGVLPSAP
mmetsp:Transcript_5579/g.15635  ORF Transcript_5579/g.15635 Transcript_5579/m.15635 type:complete len:309 (+) Transcript_5579:1829-2755(+)